MKAVAFAPTVLWLAVVTWLSVSNGVQVPKFDLVATDKVAHAAAYFLLAALCVWGLRRTTNMPPTNIALWMIFAGCTLYGAFIEWVQGTYFPNRMFEYDDMVANALGALLGSRAHRLLSHFRSDSP